MMSIPSASFRAGLVLVAVVAWFGLSSPVQAEPLFSIAPKISASWQTDSNFYESETGEREVYTYLFQPGIELGYKNPKSQITLDYTLNAYDYDDRDTVPAGQAAADDDDYVGHTANLEARIKLFTRLTLGLDNAYHKTRDAGQSDRFSTATDRNKYFINRLAPLAFYEFGDKFTAGIRYRNTITDYDDGALEDFTENRGIFDIIYNLSSSTALDLEYQYWTGDYSLNSSDYTSSQVVMVLRHRFNIFSIEAGAGYHERDFDRGTVSDIDTGVYRLAVRGETPRAHLNLASEWNFNDLGSGNKYYKAHRIGADLGYTYKEKIPFTVAGYYQKSEYESTRGLTPSGTLALRDDEIYNITGSVGYKIFEWMAVSIKAGHEERASNLLGKDYDNDFLMGMIEIAYNLGRRAR